MRTIRLSATLVLIALATAAVTGLAQRKGVAIVPSANAAGSNPAEASVVQVLRFPANASGRPQFDAPSLTLAASSVSADVSGTDHSNGDRDGGGTNRDRDLNPISVFVLEPPQALLVGAALLIGGGILRRGRRTRQS
jgi:hypothetical protein